MIFGWISIGVVVVLILLVISMYNNLVRGQKNVENGWAQIDVQLKRRYDLIPNLVETVKQYAAHEKNVFEKVTLARSQAMAAAADHSGGTESRIQAETALTGALKGMMVQVEAYPDLKANQNFLRLQEELTATENKIAFARQHYNDSATRYNTAIAVFPASMIAGMFNFRDAQLWQIADAGERAVPQLNF